MLNMISIFWYLLILIFVFNTIILWSQSHYLFSMIKDENTNNLIKIGESGKIIDSNYQLKLFLLILTGKFKKAGLKNEAFIKKCSQAQIVLILNIAIFIAVAVLGKLYNLA